MDKSLFAEILESKSRIEEYKHFNGSSEISAEDGGSIHPGNLAKENSNYIFDAKYSIAIARAEKRTDNSIMKNSYIAFEITTTRSYDGETYSVWKRYKELYSWYCDLLYELEELEYNKAIAFPTYSDSWFGSSSGHKLEPGSDFVQRRRVDLQTFFQSLFCQYPKLFTHPKVVDLLQLNMFSPEAKGSSIYTKPESYYDVYALQTSRGAGGAVNGQALPDFDVPSFQPQLTTKSAAAYQRVAPPNSSAGGGMSIVNFVNPAPQPSSSASRPSAGSTVGQKKVTAPPVVTEWTV